VAAALVLSPAWTAGCSTQRGGGGAQVLPQGATLAKSDKPRDTMPAVAAADQETLGAGNRAFAFSLYQQLRSQDGNLFLSPYSVSTALAMTYAGAAGQTAQQMASALHFDLQAATLHAAFDATALALESRGQAAKGKDNQPFALHVVNQIWGQQGFELRPAFLDTLAESYGAGLFLLDFEADPEAARVSINDWVSMQTAMRIEELIAKGVLDTATRLVLTNAIYFNAAWHLPFDPKKTQDGSFAAPSGEVVAKMMQQTAALRYAEGDGYQAVELPYDEQKLDFVAVLPAAGRFDEIESGFDDALLQAVLSALSERMTAVTMPRFQYRTAFDLGDPLKMLGMLDAFDGSVADFSGIDGARDLFIQAVVHEAFVAVDEAGTEAAAATAVVIGTTSAPEPASITLDRPFLFAILDQPTGQILFLGRLVDPG
jgi:serpin B